MDAIVHNIGSNNPPPDLLVGELLREKLLEDHADLLARRDELLDAANRIPEISDEDVARKVGDYIKQLTSAAKAADAARVGAKEPYLEGSRGVDGFFKNISEPLADVKKRTEAKLTAYLREKEAIERRRRQEEERLAREAAEAARLDAERSAAALRDEKSLDDAINADAALDHAQADLVKAEISATAKASELSQTRGEYGSMSSLRTSWVFEGVDREVLDLEKLRAHLPLDSLEKAIRSFIRAGGRELQGTRIFETTNAVVR